MDNEVSLEQLLKEEKISPKTYDKVKIAKSYIEKKYSIKKVKEEEKRRDWELINRKLDDLSLSSKDKDELKQGILHKEAEQLRQRRQKIEIQDFEPLTIIGRGAFGEVRICRFKYTGDIVAIKKMKKDDMQNKNQIMHLRTEKEIMATIDNPWIVQLRFSFQDDNYLYLVMDYSPGGDLMNLLIKEDTLSEEMSRFYIAEMILGVEMIHKNNCIHRDLKPDNILIDKKGHIQLSDFGLAKLSDKVILPMTNNDDENNKIDDLPQYQLNDRTNMRKLKTQRRNRQMAFSVVGTPDYIAPEVFEGKGYGKEVDWWSIGVMLFEMIIGYPPFFCDDPNEAYQKIIKWRKYFQIPKKNQISREAENLIRGLICAKENRLGLNGADEIKKHPFFKGVDWNNIRNAKAPFIPILKNDWDSKYFDTFPEGEPFYPPDSKKRKRKDMNYIGYTYNRDNEMQKDGFVHALEVLDVVKISMLKEKEKEMQKEKEKEEEREREKERQKEKESIKNFNSNIHIKRTNTNGNCINDENKNNQNNEIKTNYLYQPSQPFQQTSTIQKTSSYKSIITKNEMPKSNLIQKLSSHSLAKSKKDLLTNNSFQNNKNNNIYTPTECNKAIIRLDRSKKLSKSPEANPAFTRYTVNKNSTIQNKIEINSHIPYKSLRNIQSERLRTEDSLSNQKEQKSPTIPKVNAKAPFLFIPHQKQIHFQGELNMIGGSSSIKNYSGLIKQNMVTTPKLLSSNRLAILNKKK